MVALIVISFSRCSARQQQRKGLKSLSNYNVLELIRDLASANRELERWRHNVPIEGDYICPDSLELTRLKNILSIHKVCSPWRANDGSLQHDGDCVFIDYHILQHDYEVVEKDNQNLVRVLTNLVAACSELKSDAVKDAQEVLNQTR
jgi:hypothetical protein